MYEHEKSGEDRTNFNEDLDLIIAKYGSNVADYAFNIETTAETETISVTPNCLSASMFALKLILDGDIKCPLPCLGKK